MNSAVIRCDDAPPREIDAPQGTCLAAALDAAGFPLNTRCGGRGLCRGCEVQLETGTVVDSTGAPTAAPATIRACQTFPVDPVTLSIPRRSRLEHRPQVGETFRIDVPAAHLPLFEPVPGIKDTGFAVDLGTTTVVVLLVDLVTGETLTRAGAFNDQIRFGDNVLTRIDAGRDPAVLQAMQSSVVGGTIAPLLVRACQRAHRHPSRLAGGTIAGNTTMLHLLTGTDPTPLGIAPFTPRFLTGMRVTAGDIGLALGNDLPSTTPLHLLPGIAGYIGADITAGIHATGMRYSPRPAMLVDIGTNGEIVLQHDGRLTACATAAGPAFEGSGLRCGTRARDGAISRLDLSLDPFRLDLTLIGDVPATQATGLCGTAFLDLLARGRATGFLSSNGRFNRTVWAAQVPAAQRAEDDGEYLLRMVGGDAHPIVVGEVDVALLLQAKAAVGAGISTLLRHAGTTADQIGTLHLAGGFGMHLDVSHAIDIGLLPGFTPDQVEVVGNTSLAGAMLALIDRTSLDEMESIREQTSVLELNLDPGFEDCYIDHLSLP